MESKSSAKRVVYTAAVPLVIFSAAMPERDPGGWIVTIFLGIVGAFIGGLFVLANCNSGHPRTPFPALI